MKHLFTLCLLALSVFSFSQKQYVKLVEEKPDRYFLKLFVGNYIREMETDFDNSAYMDVTVNGDVITINVMALDEDQGGYVNSGSVHGTNFGINHTYAKIKGDVYVATEFLQKGFLPEGRQIEAPFIMYNAANGVYLHSYQSENNQGVSAFALGKAKLKVPAGKSNYQLYQEYRAVYEDAVKSYNEDVPKKRAAELMALPDDGIVSPLHKANTGKILFANSITKDNVNTAATYKAKFTVDEPIMMTIFADKGFNKFLNAKANSLAEFENINGNRESSFLVRFTASTGEVAEHTVYVKHPEGRSLTMTFDNLVFAKGKGKNGESNMWIKKVMSFEDLTSEVNVKVEFLNWSDESVVATGSFTYLPKASTRMPYGDMCGDETDVKIKDLANVKAALTANFKKALLAKEATKKLTLSELSIQSDWTEDNSLPYKYLVVNFVIKNANGKCFSGSDRYMWYDTNSAPGAAGAFVHADSKHQSILDDLYPFCDCK